MSSSTTTVGQYIFKRLHQVGVNHVFGVPGDFNMPLIDEMLNTKSLEWIGTCNELNAAYAADGYARISKTPAAVITTYGVGELSALNGISGSHSEHVPVVHVVGTPSREQIADTPFLHHAPAPTGLRSGDFLTYTRISQPFSVASEVLHDLSTIQSQVDNAIQQAIRNKRPAYIFVPVDIAAFEIPADTLNTPIECKSVPEPATVNDTTDAIIKALESSKTSVIIADALALRFNFNEKLNKLLTKTGAYGATTIMGKGLYDETHPNFLGCYLGNETRPEVRKLVENADFVLDVGPYLSDYNTGVFTRNISPERSITLSPYYLQVFGKTIHASVFDQVVDKVYSHFADKPDKPAPKTIPNEVSLPTEGKLVPNDFLNLFSTAIKPDDVVIVETGSFQPGSGEIKLQPGNQFFSQVGYGSIGFTVPASVGAAIAHSSTGGRTLLIEGDGSAQMTAQEMSAALRHGLRLTIFLINNDGYLIERALHGPKQPYNDIPTWDWTTLFTAMGKGAKSKTHKVKTVEEFTKLVNDKEFQDAEYPQLVEVIMPKFDYPEALNILATTNNDRNAKLNKEYSAKYDV